MSRPKQFEGGYLGLWLPKQVGDRLRAEALQTGRSLSDLAREALTARWGAESDCGGAEAPQGGGDDTAS